jgi:hypothetical protein
MLRTANGAVSDSKRANAYERLNRARSIKYLAATNSVCAASVRHCMGVTPGGVRGLQPPEFEVGVANVLQPPEFHQDTAVPPWQPPTV